MDDPRVIVHSLSHRSADKIVFGRPVKAVPAHLSRRMHGQEAFRITLLDCLAQINANAAALRATRSVEGLHQLRVGLRRLDVALGVFGREFRQDWLEEVRGRAKILTRRLAPARNLDVFLENLLVQPPTTDGVAALRARAEAARDIAWDAAMACVTGPEFSLFIDDVTALAASRLPLPHNSLPKTARRILDRQMKRVAKRGHAARSRDEADLHHLRIALKKLRYSAEFFAPLYPRQDVRRYLDGLKRLQDELGDLNDIAGARHVVQDLLKDGKARKAADKTPDVRTGYAAGVVAGWFGAHAPVAAGRALKRYRKFRKVSPFWH